jgi:1-aminocyclopropane-1-carboxylate deaminase
VDKLVPYLPTPLQLLSDDIIEQAGIRLYIKRDDLIHPEVSGNKWRKLKYNLADALSQGKNTLLTFGGAYSNHLYATAAAGKALDLHTIGMVRGEDTHLHLSSTLLFCQDQGMKLVFVSRDEYKMRHNSEYIQALLQRFDHPYFIPEGGSSPLALSGVGEMVEEIQTQLGVKPDYYATASGTGGTAAGILGTGSDVLAFSALKGGDFLKADIELLLENRSNVGNLYLQTDYHFGGYGKWKPELLSFIANFKNRHGIQLEQVYTGKMLFGIYDLMRKGFFKSGQVIVAVHTGGLQGLLPELRQM